MRQPTINIKGFAILEVLVATVILCGIVYAFLAFSQNQGKRVNQENTGKYLTILTNDLFESTLPGGSCSNEGTYSLTHCVSVSDLFKALMNDNGFNLDTATIKITPYLYSTTTHKTSITVTMKFSGNNYSQVNASIYAQQLFNNLSPNSMSRFTSLTPSETPSDYWFSYAIADDSGTKIQTDGSVLYFLFQY